MSIPFIDLKAQQARLEDEINAAIKGVLTHGQYILGPEVTEFEEKLAAFSETKHAIGCGNGTDALLLSLMAYKIGLGDAVFCPSFTFCATAEVIAHLNATPVFVDIDRDTYNIAPESLTKAIDETLKRGALKPQAIIAVDLFGQAADYPALSAIAKKYDIKLIADSAQGFGSTLNGKHPSHWADVTTTSFFPAKPLGCYGDGGALLTDDDETAQMILSLRFHGKGESQYDNVRVGINSRLDSLQAAIMLPKLAIFKEEIEQRNIIAERYSAALAPYVLRTPTVLDGVMPIWAQYTIEVEDPAGFAAALKEKGVPTARYYPTPLHHQTAYRDFPVQGNGLANTEDCIDKVISLPMHPYLDETTQDMIINAAIEYLST